MLNHDRETQPRLARLSALVIAAALAIAPAAYAQLLLKPGQGLVGAPQPVEPDAPEKPKDSSVTELPGVNVEGKRDALGEADRRLRERKKKLPGLGEDKDRVVKSTSDKAIDFYNSLEKDPNKLSQDSQDFMSRVVNTPDDNHREDYVTAPRRDASEYVDPIAAQDGVGSKK